MDKKSGVIFKSIRINSFEFILKKILFGRVAFLKKSCIKTY
ncbi:hypothetical protein BBUWI9123_E0001 (plasmid) [Borreliella burgdorferi WI91-23]|nr:hypothetical protein BBUWI9123_E0001 [Borreliella burgdorferi WI91-23]